LREDNLFLIIVNYFSQAFFLSMRF